MWPFHRPAPKAPPSFPAAYVPDDARPDVFDPALKHYPRAFVKGPPADGAEAEALRQAQSVLLQRCLWALAIPPVRDAVVLRGSLALEAWYPGRARRAHDLDLVIRDPAIAPDTAAAAIVLRYVRGAVLAALAAAEVRVSEDEVALDSIWTYERAEGRRLSVPWTFRGWIREVVQVDLVFREPLQDAPALTVVRDPAGAETYRRPRPERSLWFASRAESLAWKLLWLETDMNPQAKDLYDAVLLAEDVPLPLDLVRRVYAGKGASWSHGPYPGFVRDLHVEWESFAQEYPALAAGDRKAWAERLAGALRIAV